MENDSIVVALSQELQTVAEDIERLSETLKPAHPDMQYAHKIKEELEKEQLQRKQHLFSELEGDYEVASSKVNAHKLIIEQAKADLSKKSAELAEYKAAEDKLEIYKNQYTELSNRLSKLSIDTANADSIVTIGALASTPLKANSQATWESMSKMGAVGGVIGLLLSMLVFSLRQRLGSARLARAYLAQDVLAQVPNLQDLREPAVLGYQKKAKAIAFEEVKLLL